MSKLDRGLVKEQIENMNKEQQIEVLKKLTEMSNVNLNENSNGTFVNLTDLTEEQMRSLRSTFLMSTSKSQTWVQRKRKDTHSRVIL